MNNTCKKCLRGFNIISEECCEEHIYQMVCVNCGARKDEVSERNNLVQRLCIILNYIKSNMKHVN